MIVKLLYECPSNYTLYLLYFFKTTHYEGNKRVDVVKPKYELVGTRCGRRTFICTALAKGIPPSVVMKWTGHSDYKAMKPYIDIADEVKSEYMKQFDE